MDLVREYAAGKSDDVFATIVARHINLVYSAALRQSGDAQQAEEVTQAVFLILARKAASLHRDTILSGWLYQTAQFTAANARRAAIRQHRREQEAQVQFMQDNPPDDSWRRLAPVLEDAMSRLGQKERDAIILRYFENRTVGEVAVALRVNEAAAQKRVNRGTEKLRKILLKRGIPISAAVLSAAIGTNAVQAAPAALASVVAATGAVGGGSTLALTNTTLKLMAWAKAQTAAWIAAAALGATATATIAVEAVAAPARPHVQFEGEGFLLHRNLDQEGTVGLTWTNYFKVTVRDGEWRIVTQRANQQPDFSEAGYDGSELIRVIHYDNFQREQIRQGGVVGITVGANTAGADVQYSPIPYLYGNDGMVPVWFAYASQCYLDKARPGYLSPLFEPGDSSAPDVALVRMGYEQKAQLTRRAAPPGLPERAVFSNDGGGRKIRGLAAGAAPVNQTFTNCIFQALAFTNLAGTDIPAHFTISYFREKTGGASASEIYCYYEWDVHLTNLSSNISLTRFKPESPQGIDSVQDYRFCGDDLYIPMIWYYLTNADWLTPLQARNLPDYQKEAAQGPRHAASQAKSDGLLDSEGKRADRQARSVADGLANIFGSTEAKRADRQFHASFHPLNYPHSLQKQRYPTSILLAFLLAGAALLCALLLRTAARRATPPPK
jgi:RNA polymerase sigma factor (sigma-70 family)